ncbi:MAG: rane protein [Frankiales bacterium]|nr:rane protein [Frankiales bacterium]
MKRTASTYIGIAVLAVFGLGGLTGGTVAVHMVDNSLQQQKITFGTDTKWSGQQVSNGLDAYRFQNVISGHVKTALAPFGVTTYEEVSALSRASATATNPAGDPKLAAARRTALDGNLLRGTLFSSFAWWMVGWVGIAAGVAFLLLAGLAFRISGKESTLYFPQHQEVKEPLVV